MEKVPDLVDPCEIDHGDTNPFDVPNLALAADCTERSDASTEFLVDACESSPSLSISTTAPPSLSRHAPFRKGSHPSKSKRDLPSARDVLRGTWSTVLGIAALLDCISTVLPFLLAQDSPRVDARGSSPSSFSEHSRKLQIIGFDYTVSHPVLTGTLAWLEQNAVYFSFVFSLLWCVQAFRDARHQRQQALRERDRKRLLSRGDSIRFLEDDDHLNKCSYFQGTGPWLVFYATLVLQLLLVPIGFYVLLYQGVRHSTSSSGQGSTLLEHGGRLMAPAETTDKEQALWAIINSTGKVVDIPTGRQSFVTDGKLSVVMLIAKHAGAALCETLGASTKKMLVKKGRKEGMKLGVRAIINPRKVWKQAKRAMRWLRWIKYLAPLLAASNKLRGNLEELLKKYRQRQEAVLAAKIRQILWKKMTPAKRKAKAARGIQSMYRSYQVRKARWALSLIQCDRDELAAIRIETVLRQMLHRARCRIRRKRAELKKLEAREQAAVRGRKRMTMSPHERKRLYELQDEMMASKSKSIDRRLLMRPNTRFAVAWQSLFVLSVLIEILGLAVHPLLAMKNDKFPAKLVPTPVSDLQECSCLKREREELNSWILASVRPTKCPSGPWFCRSPFATAQSLYIAVMRYILENFMAIVGLIVWFDVPVHFFTGELCPEMGSIIPKPFFTRWIVPGLLLQLAVNPQLEKTSNIVSILLVQVCKIGLIRVWRWIDALFYPTLVVTFDFVENKVWIPLVAHVNRRNTTDEDEVSDEIDHPAVRRRSSMRRASTQRASLVYDVQRRRSSILEPRRSSCGPARRSSFASVAPPRRFSIAVPLTDSFYDEMKKDV